MHLLRRSFFRAAMAIAIACLVTVARAAEPAAIKAAIEKASKFLVEQGQAQDGSFSAQAGPAITALAVTALVKSGTPADAPAVKNAIAYLMKFKNADGGIHPPESPVANYETSIAMLALAACNKDGRYDKEIKAAEAFVKGLQWDDGEGPGPSDPAYGGAGYGKKNRPDLSLIHI